MKLTDIDKVGNEYTEFPGRYPNEFGTLFQKKTWCAGPNREVAILFDKFGVFYSCGAVVVPGIVLDFPGSELLLSDAVKKSLMEWNAHMNYHASFHFNFS